LLLVHEKAGWPKTLLMTATVALMTVPLVTVPLVTVPLAPRALTGRHWQRFQMGCLRVERPVRL
jgi:hypothetical protein